MLTICFFIRILFAVVIAADVRRDDKALSCITFYCILIPFK